MRFAALLLLLCTGCTCGTFDLSTTRFTCVTDADCGSEFTCVDAADGRECLAGCAATRVCPVGRECSDGRCADFDECRAGGRCGPDAVCVNTAGSFNCRCAEGFSGVTTGGGPAACVDVDECPTQDCGTLGRCANTPGSFECSCAPGTFGATVAGGPTSCSSVDRCAVVGLCGANASCQSTATSYTCSCSPGYSGAPTTGAAASCSDADECTSPGVCGPRAECTNTTGSFACACQPGFNGAATSGVAATCSDVDECATTNCGPNASCTNTPGSFTCSCDSGSFGASVIGGPATCSLVDRCSGVACGANASCTSDLTSFTCACNAGYQGMPQPGAPASCTDVDECSAANACGANASCVNTSGSYACSCQSGFTGPPTMGTPTNCVPGVVVLGTAGGASSPFVTLAQPVAVGERLVLVVVMESGSPTVTDSRGNTWVRLVLDANCGPCGSTGVWTSMLTTALQPGDRVTVSADTTSAVWLARTGRYVWLDTTGDTSSSSTTSAPFVSTSTAVLEPDELTVAALVTRSDTTLGLDGGGFVSQLTLADGGVTGIIGSRVAMGLSGVQTFLATANPPQRFSGAMATFYGGPQRAPTGLSLTHTLNSRGFLVSWTGGRGNGGANGCAVQVQLSSGTWTSVGAVNCDANTAARPVNLSATANWYGAAWVSVPARLVRSSDGVVVGTFPTSLGCAPRAPAAAPTPTIDENCDSTWDDHTCTAYAWGSGTIYPTTYTACTNSTDTTTIKTCAATNETEARYTQGMSTAQSPATVFSSNSFGVACQGPYLGATQWTCTGSGCSYR